MEKILEQAKRWFAEIEEAWAELGPGEGPLFPDLDALSAAEQIRLAQLVQAAGGHTFVEGIHLAGRAGFGGKHHRRLFRSAILKSATP